MSRAAGIWAQAIQAEAPNSHGPNCTLSIDLVLLSLYFIPVFDFKKDRVFEEVIFVFQPPVCEIMIEILKMEMKKETKITECHISTKIVS